MNYTVCIYIILFLLITGCAKEKVPAKTLIVSSYKGESAALLYIAMSKGFFIQNNLNVIIQETQGGIFAIDDLIQQKVDIVTSSEVAFVSKCFEYETVRCLASISMNTNHKFLVLKSSNILSPEDLIGKKIGVTRKSSADYALYSYLILNNIEPDQLKIVDIKPNNLISEFNDIDNNNNRIDGFISWEPNCYNVLQAFPDKFIELPAESIPNSYTLLITDKKKSETMKEELTAFIKSLYQSEEYYYKNIDECLQIIKEVMSITDEYSNYIKNNLTVRLSLPQDLIFAMEDEARWIMDSRKENKPLIPNFLHYFTFTPLKQINKQAITIIN